MTQLIVAFFNFITGIINNWLPTFTLGDGVLSNVVDAFAYFVKLISNINWLVPVNDVLLIISLLVGYKLVMFVIFIVNWIIKRIGDIIP